jgi:hypothetical protein
MSGGQVGHLLEWRQHERNGSWHAWVSWVQTTGDPPRHRHKVVEVWAAGLAPLEEPGAYRDVPRRVLSRDAGSGLGHLDRCARTNPSAQRGLLVVAYRAGERQNKMKAGRPSSEKE